MSLTDNSSFLPRQGSFNSFNTLEDAINALIFKTDGLRVYIISEDKFYYYKTLTSSFHIEPQSSNGSGYNPPIPISDVSGLQSALNSKENSLIFTPENVINKDTDISLSDNSDNKYPSQKAVKTYIDSKVTNYALNLFSGDNFGEKLQEAINVVNEGSIIDCSVVGSTPLLILSTIVISKGVTILLGPNIITATVGNGNNVFNIESDCVKIIGVSRSTKETSLDGKTRIIMTNGDYHIYGQGTNVLEFKDFDLIGIQSTGYTTNGSGGVFLIEPDPFAAGGGNNINQINIDSLLISGTKAHGIFILGCILSQINNTRVSSAGGHGFYIGASSTSMTLLNCYCSSSILAGFNWDSASYCSMINCSAEGSGVGIWLRSCFNVSVIGCGAESNLTRTNTNLPANLGILVYGPSNPSGILVNDIGSDNQSNFFKGHSIAITGGRNIYLPNFSSTDPGNAGSVGASSFTRHILLRDNVREAYITNPRLQKSGSATGTPRYDISIETSSGTPRDINLFFNPSLDGTITPTITNKYITEINSSGESTVILDQGTNTLIQSGNINWTASVIKRTIVSNINYTTLVADQFIAYTTLTASRTVTLKTPHSGQNVYIDVKDETGNCSPSIQIIVQAQNSKTIDGLSTYILQSARKCVRFYYDGTNWHSLGVN